MDPFQRIISFVKEETEFTSLADSEFCDVTTLDTYASFLKRLESTRPEVLEAELMKIQMFLEDTSLRLVNSYRRYDEAYCLQRHGQAVPFLDCFILKETEICFSEKSAYCCMPQALNIQHFNKLLHKLE
jgi:hypothetical protein